jgi:hypothetical protein
MVAELGVSPYLREELGLKVFEENIWTKTRRSNKGMEKMT